MGNPTDGEPRPRVAGATAPMELLLVEPLLLPKDIEAPAAGFFDVLARRRSRIGGAVSVGAIGSLLWHATQLRERGFDGRFGQWESRTCPSAGGIHALRLLVLPLDAAVHAGVYADEAHAIGNCGVDPGVALAANAESVSKMTKATNGTTVQLFADPTRLSSCYENHETLLWRDAGAMVATICLIADALGLRAVPLGRHGTDIVRAFGLEAPIQGYGAVHLGTA